MGFLDKISKRLGRKDAVEEIDDSLKTSDHRVHARHLLQGDSYAQLTVTSGTHAGLIGDVKDISYGGLAVRFAMPDADQTGFSPAVEGKFRVLDREIDVKFGPVRVTAQPNSSFVFAGFAFFHEGPEVLVFLREFLEPLRFGRTLLLLSNDMRNERYRGDDWSCMRGDGPTDLLLRRKGDQLDEALLTFRDLGVYREVRFSGGRLRTGRSMASESQSLAATQMASNDELDAATLRKAAFILFGTPVAHRKLAEPLLTLVTEELAKTAGRKVA